MAQITNGTRRLLGHPIVYEIFSRIIGGEKARKTLVDEYILPYNTARILDIGCGTGKILQYLPKSVQYVGFDLSDKYISFAKKKYGSRGEWFCSPVSEIKLDHSGKFDIVLASGILHHLDDSEALSLSKLVAYVLKPTGHFCTLDGCYVDGQHPIARYLISKDRGVNVRTQEGYESVVRPYFDNVKVTLTDNLLRMPYTHAIMVATKPKTL